MHLHPTPLRSLVLAGLSLVAAAVATIGAVYQADPGIELRAPDGVLVEQVPADAEPAAGQ